MTGLLLANIVRIRVLKEIDRRLRHVEVIGIGGGPYYRALHRRGDAVPEHMFGCAPEVVVGDQLGGERRVHGCGRIRLLVSELRLEDLVGESPAGREDPERRIHGPLVDAFGRRWGSSRGQAEFHVGAFGSVGPDQDRVVKRLRATVDGLPLDHQGTRRRSRLRCFDHGPPVLRPAEPLVQQRRNLHRPAVGVVENFAGVAFAETLDFRFLGKGERAPVPTW